MVGRGLMKRTILAFALEGSGKPLLDGLGGIESQLSTIVRHEAE